MGHKPFSALALALALVMPHSVQAAPADGPTAASAWLNLVDHGAYSDSWAASSANFKSHINANQWQEAVKPVRTPLGAVVTRTLTTEDNRTSLPGAPDGHYKVLRFTTQFAAKKDAIETVVLSEEAGDWKVAGYFIR